jgi:phosphoadenosine phosphosulfate reductase
MSTGPGLAIDLYARATPGFEARVAHALAVLRKAAAEHPGSIVQATSLGVEGMVITDMIARHQLRIAIGTLDTGALHDETVAMISRIEERYAVDVEVYKPVQESVVHFVKRHGDRAMYESVDLRKNCCAIRKVEPMARMVAGRSAWVTGLRREQSGTRSEVPFTEVDENGRVKVMPIADWSWADIWQYVQTYDVPYNPLHDKFFPSIGCAPCTRAIAVGEDFRAGRWWWEEETEKECGLHASLLAAPVA